MQHDYQIHFAIVFYFVYVDFEWFRWIMLVVFMIRWCLKCNVHYMIIFTKQYYDIHVRLFIIQRNVSTCITIIMFEIQCIRIDRQGQQCLFYRVDFGGRRQDKFVSLHCRSLVVLPTNLCLDFRLKINLLNISSYSNLLCGTFSISTVWNM